MYIFLFNVWMYLNFEFYMFDINFVGFVLDVEIKIRKFDEKFYF